jgi:hypothetical protein
MALRAIPTRGSSAPDDRGWGTGAYGPPVPPGPKVVNDPAPRLIARSPSAGPRPLPSEVSRDP